MLDIKQSAVYRLLRKIYRFSRKVAKDGMTRSFPGKLPLLLMYHVNIKKGERVYFRLRKKYGEGIAINITLLHGLGDVYLAAAYYKYSPLKTEGSVFTATSEVHVSILRMFGIERIEKLSQEETDLLLHFAFFIGWCNTGINILHINPSTLKQMIVPLSLGGINGLTLADLIGYSVMQVENSACFDHPTFAECAKETDVLFAEKKLIPGKTIVLAPYANSLPNFPDWFWVKLAQELQKSGFTVCTNAVSGKEKVIDGTIGLFLPYKILASFLKKAGYVIGIRSGFFDVISSIPCKKIVLYSPALLNWPSDLFTFCSLQKMGICPDAVEFQVSLYRLYDIIDEIKKHMTQ